MFPLVGALVGFAIGLLWTAGTQISYPLVTGGKPLLSIPPMTVIMYAPLFVVLCTCMHVVSRVEDGTVSVFSSYNQCSLETNT